LLAGLVELVYRPGFAKPRGQLGGGFGRRLRFRQEVDELARGNRAIVGAPRFVGDAERLFGSAQLRLVEAFRGNLGPRRQGRKRDDIGDELHLALERRPGLDASPRIRWVRRKALSDPFSIGNGELVICRLQTAVVEQRDLDRGVGGERAPEKAANRGAGGLGLFGRADRSPVLLELLLRDRGDHPHPRIRRKPGAAGNERSRREDRANAPHVVSKVRHPIDWNGRVGVDVPTSKHRGLLLTGFRPRGDALVLLAPGRRLDRPLALVGSDGRAVADRRRARPGVGWVRGRQRSRGCPAATVREKRKGERQ